MDRREFMLKGAWGVGILGASTLLGCKPAAHGTAGTPPPSAGTPLPPGSQGTAAAAPTSRINPKVGSNRVLDAPPAGVHAAVATKGDPGQLLKSAMQAFGGVDAVIRKGDVVVIKPNLAWARAPQDGANTSPEVLKAVIQMAKEAGAREVLVVEHTCDSSSVALELSGGKEVCQAMGVQLIALDSQSLYEEKSIALGKNIKSDLIARDILECDVYINVPTLKHHSATTITVAMKNQLGCNFNRQKYHSTGGGRNLHQNIADLATALRPTLVVVDATRVLTTNGPKGPGTIKHANTIIVTHDMVTADALGAQMLGHTPADIPHIKFAGDAGVGSYDLQSLNIARV